MPDSRAAERLTQPPPRVADGPLVCQVTILPARLPNQSVLILLLVLPLVPGFGVHRGTLWAALFGSFPAFFFLFLISSVPIAPQLLDHPEGFLALE